MHPSASLRGNRENAPIKFTQSGENGVVWPPLLLQHIVYNSDAVDLQVATARTRSCGCRLLEKMFPRERKIKRRNSIINSLLFERNLALSQDRTYYGNSSENACLSFASDNGEEIKYAKSTS
ncbi:hypothetical protein AVEN_34616-1 [Araneus ventricosus]|uniref:Uncharacterized protein n=1 Tax=Araneus ventricosus TaxID=182803 RepID=A0A4Y2AZY7_ARAVE|nr:hypothetical protein AVEN_34616-1 [Araneus ventricosus]